MTTTLVELCAGTASTSLAWLRADATCPLTLAGSKRQYRMEILKVIGLVPGTALTTPHSRIILNEPGPFGHFWRLVRTEEGRESILAELRYLTRDNLAYDPRQLWNMVRTTTVPLRPAFRVASWALLQHWSWGAKLVWWDERWRTHGFDKNAAYRHLTEQAKRENLTKSRTLDDLIQGIQKLPDLDRVWVEVVPAQQHTPPRRADGYTVLIDPFYQNTSVRYGCWSFPRADVVLAADAWAQAGARVLVHEAEPVRELAGWHSMPLTPPKGRGRTFSAQQKEWITTNWRVD